MGEYGSCTGDGAAWLPKENPGAAEEFWQSLGKGKPVKINQDRSMAPRFGFRRTVFVLVGL
jgi:hypothetical protein